MEGIQIRSNNKSTQREALKDFMLSHCDADIQEQFGIHFYTMEPLLLQLIRELQRLRYATDPSAFEASVRTVDHAGRATPGTERSDYAEESGNSETPEPTESQY